MTALQQQQFNNPSATAFAPALPLPPSSLQLQAVRHKTCARLRTRPVPTSAPSLSANASNAMPTVSPKNKFQAMTWSHVERLAKHLVSQTSSESFDAILGITRGGLVPATLLSEALEIRNVVSATVFFYTDDGEQYFGMTEPRFLSFPSGDILEGRRVLIVDDVWDTGRTVHAVKERVLRANPKLVKIAVLHYKTEMNSFPGERPDYYAETTSDWIVYPWEYASPRAPLKGVEGGESSSVMDQENTPH